MDDLFKKFLNTGVGFLAQGNKRVQAALDKLVQESKISEQEGQKIMADLRKSSETKRADLEKQFQGLTSSLRERVGLGTDDAAKAAPAAPKAKPAAKKPAASPAAQAATSKASAAKPKKPASSAKKPAAPSTDHE